MNMGTRLGDITLGDIFNADLALLVIVGGIFLIAYFAQRIYARWSRPSHEARGKKI